MSKSLKNIPGSKQRSSSTNFNISLHFNKADEEQLEISYGEQVDEKSNQEETSKEISKIKDSDITGSSCVINDDNAKLSSPKKESDSKDSNRDSVVKDYWSRLSKRASSLDSDLATSDKNSDQNEGWMFFKDIKGKLAKTLEERKQKDISRKIAGSESVGSFTKEDYDRLLFEEDKSEDKSLQLSPAIEVLDGDNLDDEFANYVEDELEKVKCDIVSSKTDKLPSTFQKADNPDEHVPQISRSFLDENPPAEEKNESVSHKSEKGSSNTFNGRSYIREVADIATNFYYSAKSYWNGLLCRLLVAVLALCFVPVPSWFSGFIAGAFISGYVVYQLQKSSKPKEKLFIPEFNHTPNVKVTEAEEGIIYKGWMNELPSDLPYNPDTYHVNCTRSVYVRLDGSYLRVSYPQTNIPKRAMYNEPRFERQFIHQQHYDITAASVELLPTGLVKKRLWSKKYPICLTVPNTKQSILSSGSKDSTDLNTTPRASSKKDSPIKKLTPRINENNKVILILFTRTDRDKDLWYYRFKRAARIKLLKNHSPISSPDLTSYEVHSLENKRTISADLDTLQMDHEADDFVDLSMSKQQKFELYMSRLMAPLRSDPFLVSSSLKDKKNSNSKSTSSLNSMSWLNGLIGRLFFDFITEDMWAQCVSEKIRKKLSKLKLPVFLTELNIKDINLGTALPKIHGASEPTTDHRGIWVDIDVSYNGSFQMTLETKLNLLRYRSDPDDLSLSDVSKGTESLSQVLRSPVYNSEEEDSAESSSDDDSPAPEPHEIAEESSNQAGGGSAGKKLLRLVDRFAQSTYFQSAAKNKYIKKAMEDISNTPLVLTVEVQWLAGTLALNIPPMPTDRLWYGFRTNPYLSIVARPKLGHHAVTLTHITEWIERKLVLEFQKLLVMPNMDDLIIPIMQPDLDLPKS